MINLSYFSHSVEILLLLNWHFLCKILGCLINSGPGVKKLLGGDDLVINVILSDLSEKKGARWQLMK